MPKKHECNHECHAQRQSSQVSRRLQFPWPVLAQAAQGFHRRSNRAQGWTGRSIPDRVEVQAGAEVNVFGCLSGNSGANISIQDDRGWVSVQDLEVLFQTIGVKIVEVHDRDRPGGHLRG